MTEFDSNEFRSLRAELARMSDPGIAVPPEMDAAILSEARRSFLSRRRKWAMIQRIGAGLAAAAVLAIAVRVFLPNSHSPVRPLDRPQLAQVADINQDGKVDILDAFVVARHIARHDPLDKAWDINGDGVVDQKDVDLIATLAVHVNGGKPQ